MPEQNNGYYSFTRSELTDGTISYEFLTAGSKGIAVSFNGSEYVEYLNDYPLLLGKGYGLNVHKLFDPVDFRAENDGYVGNTICEIINDFIGEAGDDVILLYHCDFSDDRQGERSRLFQRMHRNSKFSERLLKYEVEIEQTVEGVKHSRYLGYFIGSTHPRQAEIQLEFDDFYVNLTMKRDSLGEE